MSGRRSLYSRYKQTNLWTRFGFWGSLTSIISFAVFFLPARHNNVGPQASQQTWFNAPVYQANRDIVINNYQNSNSESAELIKNAPRVPSDINFPPYTQLDFIHF